MEIKQLFEPIRINRIDIKNRIVMPSMGLSFTDRYAFNDRYRAFYRARAKGGVGLMTIGPLAIDRVGSVPLMPGLFDDRNSAALKQLLDELHRETDVRVATQLMHMGRYAYSLLSGAQPIAPSPIPSKLSGETPRQMSLEDIEAVQAAYVAAALRAVEVGFDFIEILACTGYLISQFLSPLTNHRTDGYGGSSDKRMRFGLEVIGKVRAAVGPDVALGVRVAGNDFMRGGNTNTASARFCAAAEKAGADAINVTGGWHETHIPQLTTNVPPGVFLYLARGIKEQVGIPVFASNRLGNPLVAEQALRAGVCDMICWGRPLIADPELPNKVRTGQTGQITPCIACNQGCFDSIFSGSAVYCVMNPMAGKENDYQIEPAVDAKKIYVAGGGPAGMAFAETAARRGHRVTLFEQTDRLGGQINIAKAPPGKKEFHNIIESLQNRMACRGVDVRLGTSVTPALVDREQPDVLVVASGAVPVQIAVPGADRPHVLDAWDVLSGRTAGVIGKNVVIVGGNATGCETAHYIANMGVPDPETFTFLMYHGAEDPDAIRGLLHTPTRNIAIIDLVDKMAAGVGRTGRWSLMKCLRCMDVDMKTGTRLVEIGEKQIVIEDGHGPSVIPADTVIMAVGARPNDALSDRLQSKHTRVIRIGDAKQPRKIADAIREGFEAALHI
jgi:2,4-dienoyl-CoA reductase (NADPH2)